MIGTYQDHDCLRYNCTEGNCLGDDCSRDNCPEVTVREIIVQEVTISKDNCSGGNYYRDTDYLLARSIQTQLKLTFAVQVHIEN